MKRHLITILFLCTAIALYAVGAAAPATGLFILGVLFELIFWWRVLCRDKAQRD